MWLMRYTITNLKFKKKERINHMDKFGGFGSFHVYGDEKHLFVDVGEFEINPLLLKKENRCVQIIHTIDQRNMFNIATDYDIYFGHFLKYDKDSGDIWYNYNYTCDDNIPDYHTLIFHKPSCENCNNYKWFTVNDTQPIVCSKSYKKENYNREMYKIAKMMYLHHSNIIINESLSKGDMIFIKSDDSCINGSILVCTEISDDRKSAKFIDIKRTTDIDVLSVNSMQGSHDLRFVKLVCE